jgi:hypothetical protein
MPIRPGPFVCGQIALALARVPGRLERDEDEAYRILDHIIASYRRGEFTDEEVVVWFGEPSQLRTLKSLPEDARGEIESLFLPIWREAVMLTFDAAKRYLEASTLAGARRLLDDWFTDNASPRSSHRPEGSANSSRPTAARLDEWMAANVQHGAKRDDTIADCRSATGATFREAKAAFARLPDEMKLKRGQKPTTPG